jgi:hypothetical protein
MYPLPGQAVPLALINATIDGKVAEYKANQNAPATANIAETVASARQDPAAIAKGLILQAELLEADAAAKREEAYTLDPASKPGRGRPATPEELKDQKLEERKAKRRERDQRKSAEAKVTKVESALDAKVAAKLARDAARASKA